VGDAGEINARSKLLDEKMPRHFTRLNQVTGWREFRWHHMWPPGAKTTTVRGQEIVENKWRDISFPDYKHLIQRASNQCFNVSTCIFQIHCCFSQLAPF
jgi:hypothetical protein